jgi:uncharacterized lipoprotein YmbA
VNRPTPRSRFLAPAPTPVLILILILMLAACGTPIKERFYVLSASPMPARAPGGLAYRVAVGPVTVPAAVDRPQVVLRVNANRVALQEQSRWAEPLKESIPRVIAGNLAALLGDAQVAADAQDAAVTADCRVTIDIQRFDSVLGEAATLEALWRVTVTRSGAVTNGRFVIREPAGGQDFDALAAAHSRALAALSQDIAAGIHVMRSRCKMDPGN